MIIDDTIIAKNPISVPIDNMKRIKHIQFPGSINKYLPQLMNALSIEKNEEEKSIIFEDRLISELKNIFEIAEL